MTDKILVKINHLSVWKCLTLFNNLEFFKSHPMPDDDDLMSHYGLSPLTRMILRLSEKDINKYKDYARNRFNFLYSKKYKKNEQDN